MASIIFIAVICVQALQLGSSARTLQEFHEHRKTTNARSSRRELGMFSCGGNGNPMDDCWRCDPNWADHRQRLADCAKGFGKNAVGGKNGQIYVVTRTDDHPVNPQPGTLRYGVTRDEPLWIIFPKEKMRFSFKEELIVNSYKTIDGRGSKVEIIGPACITVQFVTNIIISNLKIENCKPTGNAMVRSSTSHVGYRTMADGDAISIFGSRDVWVDHCTLSSCTDGLIDAVAGSTDITVSSCYFSQHNEVMLLGHSDKYTDDKKMRVTIAFNHFGEGLTQRMPRCRLGLFHVICNLYSKWGMYAIGGSGDPTILSQGNKFIADPDNPRTLEVTKRIDCLNKDESKDWNWMSDNDIMMNGAYFTTSGSRSINNYGMAESLAIELHGSNIDTLTADAGVLHCYEGTACS